MGIEFDIVLMLTAVAIVVIAGLLWFIYDVGYNVADEGYLWYGMLRTVEGKIPIRDFRAYDPGRYYWVTAWSGILGKDILSIRISSYLLLLVAVVLAVYPLYPEEQNGVKMVLGIILLVLNAQPVQKIIDSCMPMFSVFFLYLVLKDPAVHHVFLWSIWIGVSWFMGLNHFIYNLGTSLAIIIYLLFKQTEIANTLILNGIAGLAIGLIPMILFLLVPGNFQKYWRKKILPIVLRRSTNLKIRIPWPHRTKWRMSQFKHEITNWAISLSTWLLPIWYIVFICLYLVHPAWNQYHFLGACSLIGLFYLNHFFSRADHEHLQLSSVPIILALVFASSWDAFGMLNLILLLLFAFFVIIIPLYKMVGKVKYGPSGQRIKIWDRSIFMEAGQAHLIKGIIHILSKHDIQNNQVLLTPMLVGIYPLLEKESPVYDTFPVYPANSQSEYYMMNSYP